jgi:hypothetical protein
VLHKDIPYGKIIETMLSTQPYEMVPELPFLIPGIVFLTAAPIFPAAFDSDFLKILDEIPLVIPKECF